jgi:hypothetical protein
MVMSITTEVREEKRRFVDYIPVIISVVLFIIYLIYITMSLLKAYGNFDLNQNVLIPSLTFLLPCFLFLLIGIYVFRKKNDIQDILPSEGIQLLSQIKNDDTQEIVNGLVKISSLRGITGFFTKLNITGLPLATIILTLIFAIIGVIHPTEVISTTMFDFAKLTLGAFIGSFVNKNQETIFPKK